MRAPTTRVSSFDPSFVIALSLVLLCGAVTAGASPPEQASLVVETGGGVEMAMPLRHTDVVASVSAFVARVEVIQTFGNPFSVSIEAIYKFPLPERAAVDDFLFEVGERRIRGEIHRREEATAIYEQARRAGHAAALLDQERPNVFTQSIANIPPGEDVRVHIFYVERLVYEAGEYRFLFPMVVGPRFFPPSRGAVEQAVNEPGEERLTAPIMRTGQRTGHDIAIAVHLEAGVPIRSVTSASHAIQVERTGISRARVTLAPHDVIPNKDFMLRWNVAAELPEVGVLAHRRDGDGFFALLLQPRAELSAEEAAPKEIIFVLDESGSMSGVPIEMSKRFMRAALRSMGTRDRFNIVRFAGHATVLSPDLLDNTERNVERGLDAVEEMAGSGGTMMLEGFRAALSQPRDLKRMRIVLFLTDGYIGNEAEILDQVRSVRGDARIFTLGIGSSVNHYLLREMAELGQGAYTYVRPNGNEAAAVDRFHGWVTKPYLTDLEIDWGALGVEDVQPARLPDLYAGQTLSVVGRYLWGGSERVILKGRLGGVPWERTVRIALPEASEEHEALASVWGREKIRTLTLEAPMDPVLQAEVTSLALAFRLMSPFTSFVAVDDSRIVSAEGEPIRVEQALPLPEFVSFKGVFGIEGPQPFAAPEEIFRVPGVDKVLIQAMGDIVDVTATMTRRSGSKKKPVNSLSIIGGNYQDVLTAAPGVTDTDGDGNPNVHGARDTILQHRLDGGNINAEMIEELEAITSGASVEFGQAHGGFANVVTRSGLPRERKPSEDIGTSPESDRHFEELALRVLADLADDRALTRSEGLPALTGLLAAQRVNGAFSADARIHELATWALAEVAAAAPDLPWVHDALWRAREFVVDPGAAYRCSVVGAPFEAMPQASLPICSTHVDIRLGEGERDTGHAVALLLPASKQTETMRLISRIVSGLAERRLCGDPTGQEHHVTR